MLTPWNDDRLAANGLPIAINFKTWFNLSQVVDDNKLPLVVYHGTTRSFNAFKKVGKVNFNTPQKVLGFFFTDSPEYADKYNSFWREGADFKEGANTVPVYLAIRNPKFEPIEKIDEVEDVMTHANAQSYRGELISQGYDGIVFEGDTRIGRIKEYVAFDSVQIKSAIGNSGLYLKDSPSLTDDGYKLALLQAQQAKAVVSQMAKAREQKAVPC